MGRIVLDMQSELFAEAVTKALTDSNLNLEVYRASKPEEIISLCRACHANVLVMEVVRQGV